MLTRKPYSGPNKLILAFDVGTTYSGISYCFLQEGEIPEICGVTKFPGQAEGSTNAKVPSILYYDTVGNVKAVGSEALSMDAMSNADEQGWALAKWWKLHLRPKHLSSAHIKDEDVPPLPPRKSAVDVLTDFVKYLFACARTHIEEHYMGLDWESIQNSVEYVFSHPNGWEGLQQQKYREAIERAGLIPLTGEGRSRVYMITEGEASLHYCISRLHNEFVTSGPQTIVIVDAGGGTVDLSAYSVAFSPIACREVAPSECRLQGAVFVTQRAGKMLKRKLQGSPHTSPEDMEELIREFDETTKLKICSPDEPVYLKVGGLRYNDSRYNIKRGALTLSGKESTALFDESIEAIIKAFDQQRKVVTTQITMVFLVGGMGANNFVWSRLQSYFRARGIKLCRPDNVNKAAASGAVIFRIDCVVNSRVARATYGIPCNPLVDKNDREHRRRRHQWEKGASGEYRIKGGFLPILYKGDQINDQDEIRHMFFFDQKDKADFGGERVEITCYRGNLSDPQWLDEDASSFSSLCTIELDLSKVSRNLVARRGASGEVYYRVDIDVVAFFGSTELKAYVAWKHDGYEKRTPVTIIYYDD